jgi:hypothetical protein
MKPKPLEDTVSGGLGIDITNPHPFIQSLLLKNKVTVLYLVEMRSNYK